MNAITFYLMGTPPFLNNLFKEIKTRNRKTRNKMLKKDKPMLSVDAIIQSQGWDRSFSGNELIIL